MPVTIKVNGVSNSLVHKGSNGISMATIPDVCKTPTPGGPVPLPYPNISQATTLDKGTTTVKADGGMMIAIKGSEYSMSNGDEPGSIGGVKSNTFIKESTWILYSFDVKIDGKNACRLTDKKFQNHENTVDLSGNLQMPTIVTDVPPELQAIADCCNKAVDCKPPDDGKGCTSRGRHKHTCCQDAINRKKAKGDWDNVTPEEYHPPTRTMDASRLDVQIRSGGATTHIWDFKFNCSKKPTMSAAQRRKYRKRFTGALVIDKIGAQGLPNKASKAKKTTHCAGAQAKSTC
ncbi:MAG: DUF4150 domain-containing protein [Methylococcales bacterium]